MLPQVSVMVPFAMTHHAQFRPGHAPGADQLQYAVDVNEVKAKGRATGSTRLMMRRKSPGCGMSLRRRRRTTWPAPFVAPGAELVDTARLFALLNIASADALIYVFDAKYTYNLWRPYHAIRLADTDCNPATDPDLAWTSLIQPTPNHQEYPSAHSAISTSGLRVLMNLLGDQHTVILESVGYPSFTHTYPSFSGRCRRCAERTHLGRLTFSECVPGSRTRRLRARRLHSSRLPDTAEKPGPPRLGGLH